MQPSDDFVADDDFTPDVDASASARRAASGQAPGPQEYTDEQLGLDPGVVKGIHISPLIEAVAPGTRAEYNKIPNTAEEAASRDRMVSMVEGEQRLRDAQRTIGAAALAAPVAAAGEGMALAAGVGPKLATLLGGGAAGGVGATVATGKASAAPQGAALGAAGAGLSQLMGFVVGRMASPIIAKGFARAANEPALTGAEAANVVNKYDVGSIKNPTVALEALSGGITKATKTAEEAWNVVRASGNNLKSPLVIQAVKAMNAANREKEILKAMVPIARKVAAAASLKPTMLERVATGAGKSAKAALAGATGAGVYKMLAGDK